MRRISVGKIVGGGVSERDLAIVSLERSFMVLLLEDWLVVVRAEVQGCQGFWPLLLSFRACPIRQFSTPHYPPNQIPLCGGSI